MHPTRSVTRVVVLSKLDAGDWFVRLVEQCREWEGDPPLKGYIDFETRGAEDDWSDFHPNFKQWLAEQKSRLASK